jgi:hypothetical protein
MSSPIRRAYDSLEESFFSKPVVHDEVDEPLTDARGAAARLAIEHAFVEARRARFARYVTAATLMAALICVAALALH